MAISLARLVSFALAAALATAGCSAATEPPDAATLDMGTRDVGSIDSSVAPDAADAPSVADTGPSDTGRSDTGPSDAARDTGLSACALPLGGTCARGATCPAGDGCNDCTCPASGGDVLCTARPCAARDAGTHACSGAGDCRLFASYCAAMPCVCIALGAGEPDPVCTGGMTTCLTNPCLGRTASCAAGVCTDSTTL